MPTISTPKKLKQSRVQCSVTFTQEEVERAESSVLSRAASQITVPGFRAGKAPADMVRAKMNPEQLMEETIRMLLPGVLTSVIKEHGLQPIIPPKVDLESRDPMTLTLTLVERPEVSVKGAEKISIKPTEVKADDKDIDRMVDYLRNQHRKLTPVQRAAAEGDQVTLDFSGAMDGKDVEGTKATGYSVVIGSKSLIPGFEEALVGLSAGNQKSFPVTFPADYHAEHLRGKPVTFSVTVHAVAEVSLPEVTDAWVKEQGLGASAADLRSKISESMREQEVRMDHVRRERELFDAIRDATKIDLAPELIAQEERIILEEIAENLSREQQTLEQWLQSTKRTWEKLQEEVKTEASKRLTLRFGIQWLLNERNVTVSDDDINVAIAAAMAGMDDATKKKEEARYKKGEEGYEQIEWRLRVEKLVADMLK